MQMRGTGWCPDLGVGAAMGRKKMKLRHEGHM